MSCDYYVCGVNKPLRLEFSMSHRSGPAGGWFWSGYEPTPIGDVVAVHCQCGHLTCLADYDAELGDICPSCWEPWGPKAASEREATEWWVPVYRWLLAAGVTHVRFCTEYIDEDWSRVPAWWADTRWTTVDGHHLHSSVGT